MSNTTETALTAMILWEELVSAKSVHPSTDVYSNFEGRQGAIGTPSFREEILALAPLIEQVYEAHAEELSTLCFDWEYIPALLQGLNSYINPSLPLVASINPDALESLTLGLIHK